ncbi:conserved oligomeric Golgi complex subunit 2 isoform X2 [Bos indicus x Bos taurus]|uniref:conserved oligomeric Golgi complex subunit 2 isoform X4 n=1 Tax=Bos taurus TaxID=9913 RepID=UPI000383EDD7|nr:conserved oligomeric Golgi complex subunit 2 isoform X4 [Bos taurus]XP_027386593.1 conserved oligomeric Golgi complex subunit 2 isoform X2 [Bos indicus x Bos taurus]XP_061261758.1 conserved oligomeric Golgi complex subunit 2 isoform X5 [Bos javanicus]
MEKSRMNLPKGPDTLCFDKDEFMKEDFDVDHFVSDCRKRVQLEALRDDLELYYKLLKTAMVELINKDYADFVNLSTNLVGMDKALSQLSVPLGQLREEVLSLRSSVSEGIRAVDERLSKQEDIRKKKICVLRLIQVIRSVEKIEKILNSQHSKETSALEASSPLLTGQILERIATEFNQLQFHAVQSKGLPLLDKVRPRIAGITAMLQQSLEGLLLEGLQTSSVDIIRHCLRTYATIDKTRDAEALVGQVLVKPYVDEVILEQIVDSHLSDLQLMYDKLLEFVPHHCRLLREVTGGAISSEKGNTVPGYDFLVNSVWPEIVRGLEEKLPSLFNPGDPDAFHQKYTISMDFVRTFERQCGSQASVKRLRAHPAYHSFNNKWNLPVYFQIRFREIAGSLEAALTDILEDAPAGSPYRLLASHRTWSSLQRCWSDKMFLPLLAHRLWRLTLQILARYSIFVKELLLRPISNESAKDVKKPLVTGSKDLSITQGNCEDQASGPSETKPIVSVSSTQLVYVVTDLHRLQEQLPELLETIKPKLEVMGFKNFSSISALEDSQLSLSACVPALSEKITQDLSESCFSHLKSALEVPRLYRRTNKEVPVTASSYVDSALKPLYQLQSRHKDKLKQATIRQWLEATLSESTHKYYETVSDVLNSVRKMEESLKRLKQARRTTPASPAGLSGGGMSDDDKIRRQLALDVAYLGEQIEKMGLRTKDIRSFPALAELVAAAKDQATAEQP